MIVLFGGVYVFPIGCCRVWSEKGGWVVDVESRKRGDEAEREISESGGVDLLGGRGVEMRGFRGRLRETAREERL